MPDYPIVVTLEVTGNCNHYCGYCYNCDRDAPASWREVTLHHFGKVLNRILEFSPLEILITGGEPLLRRDLMLEVMKAGICENLRVILNSNLALLTREDLALFSRYNLRNILTSLYSHKQELQDATTTVKGSFDRVVRNIKLVLTETTIPLTVNTVVTKENVGDVLQTGLFVKEELGCNRFSVSLFQPAVKSKASLMLDPNDVLSMLDALLELKHVHKMEVDALEPHPPCMFSEPEKYKEFIIGRNCSLGCGLTVKANGDVSPCVGMPALPLNILTHPFEEIDSVLSSYRPGNTGNSAVTPDACRECAEVELCNGGCRVAARVVNGDIKSPHPHMMKPLSRPLNLQVDLVNFLASGFQEPLNDISFRKNSGSYSCRISHKLIYLSPSEFALLQLILKEENLFRCNLDQFISTFNLDANKFNFFLNKLSQSQGLIR